MPDNSKYLELALAVVAEARPLPVPVPSWVCAGESKVLWGCAQYPRVQGSQKLDFPETVRRTSLQPE